MKKRVAFGLCFILLTAALLFGCSGTGSGGCRHEKTNTYIENRINATTISEGRHDEVLRCADCNAEIERKTVTDAKLECKTHTDADSDFLCDTCGVRYISDSHTHAYICTVETLAYQKQPATCEDAGVFYYSCGCGKANNEETFVGKEILPHEYTVCRSEEEYLVKAGDCASAAEYYKSCRCGKAGEETFFGTAHDYVGGKCSRCNKSYEYEANGDYVYIGEYPQSLKARDVEISETVDVRGYYLGSDGNYYAKKIAKVCTKQNTRFPEFSNGESFNSGDEYYFKVEPIRWRILKDEGSGKMLLLCDSVIDAGDFYYVTWSGGGMASSNYSESNIRKRLNGEFYSIAFSGAQSALILTTEVDNTKESAGNETNKNICENTQDKIFILSYSEITNAEYGFASDTDRQLFASDYARASYLYFAERSYNGNGFYWLRSPREDSVVGSKCVTSGGAVSETRADYDWYGTVPAMWIQLK